MQLAHDAAKQTLAYPTADGSRRRRGRSTGIRFSSSPTTATPVTRSRPGRPGVKSAAATWPEICTRPDKRPCPDSSMPAVAWAMIALYPSEAAAEEDQATNQR
ncbi:hypothetical protein GCM10011578_053650 [Streptomyces fuscichromogenes]|uniref:Uncharacterized protein n=1 Tax=Streptomyces fuscichromogenes TaxID=1324013 RepID=A0A917XG14_9ACTN|nr:hypothetical protein GCM10011578_053650 [Streptomyces fuscichromogenes]